MKNLERLFAEKLLKIKAIKLQPANPFTWASGWKSPFYCDNRKTLSYPSLRNFVKIEITRLILERFGQVDAIAGVATGAIPQGALVADALNLPFVYVRSTPKDHGLENLIEGELRPGMKVVVVEDLISTGGSSCMLIEAIGEGVKQIDRLTQSRLLNERPEIPWQLGGIGFIKFLHHLVHTVMFGNPGGRLHQHHITEGISYGGYIQFLS